MTDVIITFLTPERFAAKPQVGLAITQEWHSLARWLTGPSFASTKQAHGAWCPAALEGGAVKGGKGAVYLLVADVDDCGAGAIAHSAEVLVKYAGAVIPTFSATREREKHRIVLLPGRALTADEFPLAWARMASTLADCGITVDKGCKNVNRLFFACVSPSPARWNELGGARILTGSPVPVDAMLAAARDEQEEERRERERQARARRPVREEQRDRYVAAALEKARGNIASASEGGRHDALLRESYSLARLGLDAQDIERELLEAFVAVAGEPRRFEGHRAIRDAVNARGQGAA
jgi:hypothetical protein